MFFVQNMNLMCFCGLSRANILLSYYRFPNLFSEALRKSKPTENQLAWQAEGRPKSGRSSVAEVQWIPPSRLWWAASSNAKVASCKCWMPWGESCQTWEVRMYEWSITHLRLGGGFLAPTAPHRGKTGVSGLMTPALVSRGALPARFALVVPCQLLTHVSFGRGGIRHRSFFARMIDMDVGAALEMVARHGLDAPFLREPPGRCEGKNSLS